VRTLAAPSEADIAALAASGDRELLVAEDEQGICGTVQLVLDLPENQPHRADVSKMLVHRRARRRGVGEALMRAADAAALAHRRTVRVLDTASDDARRLYERLGWIKVGDIPAYALMPDGSPCATTYYFRELAAAGRP
jgi:ribosomal protein S18 acetylase RimI-like enzyme